MNYSGKRVAQAAIMLMITVAISRVLGYGREVVMYTIFGQNYITDAYRAAFSIPDFIYMLLVGGALSSAFIPVFSSYLAAEDSDEGWRAASIVFNYVMIVLMVLVFFAFLYTRKLIYLLVPGLPPEYLDMAVSLTHIMFFQTFFMALNGFAMGILNSYNNFTAPALGSLVYNLVIILVGVAWVNKLGIAAFSYGVVLGAVINFAVQIPALRKVGLKYNFSFDWRHPGFKQIILLMIPVLAGLGVVQFNLFVTQNLSSGLGSGVVSALNLAQRIMNLPIGIFATSIAIAVFPTLTFLAAKDETGQFKRTSTLGIKSIFLVTIPSAAGMIALGDPMIRLLFQQGEFTDAMVLATNQCLTFYCLGLAAYSAIQVANRSFYALKDTLTPVIAAFITIGFNVFFSLKLVSPMGHQGLALAYSLAGFVNLVFLLLVLRWKIGPINGRELIGSFTLSLLASGVMYAAVKISAAYVIAHMGLAVKVNLFLGVGIGLTVGVLVYGFIIYMLKLEESEMLLGMVRNKFKRSAG